MNRLNNFIKMNIADNIQMNKLDFIDTRTNLRRILELVPENSTITLDIESIENSSFCGEISIKCQELKFSTNKIINQHLETLLSDLKSSIKSKILTWNSNRVFTTYIKDTK